MDTIRQWLMATEDNLLDLDMFLIYIDGRSEEEDALWEEIVRELGLDEPNQQGVGASGLAPTASEDGFSSIALRDADTTTEPPQTRTKPNRRTGGHPSPSRQIARTKPSPMDAAPIVAHQGVAIFDWGSDSQPR